MKKFIVLFCLITSAARAEGQWCVVRLPQDYLHDRPIKTLYCDYSRERASAYYLTARVPRYASIVLLDTKGQPLFARASAAR